MHVREIGGDKVTLEQVRPQLERLVRLDQERLLMDRLARRLLQRATVMVIDGALRNSWDTRRGRGATPR